MDGIGEAVTTLAGTVKDLILTMHWVDEQDSLPGWVKTFVKVLVVFAVIMVMRLIQILLVSFVGWASGVLRTMIGAALFLVRLPTVGMMIGIARMCPGSQTCRYLPDWLSRNPDCALNAGSTGASYGAYGRPEVTTGLGTVEAGTDAMALAIDCVDPDPTSNADPGRPRPNDNTHKHHIIAKGDARASMTRLHAASLGFNISDPVNIVILPANRGSRNPDGSTIHSTMHTHDYHDYVEERVLGQSDYEGVRREVELIGKRLKDGDDIWYPERSQ